VDKQPTKFNITRQFLEKTKAKLDAFLHHTVRDEQFRVFTFEHDDYAQQKLTLLLFDFIPTRVFVTVPPGYNLSKAVEEMEQLNPGLAFQKVKLDYCDPVDIAKQRQTQELRIIYLPLSVDVDGKLVQ
jgi:hypothetical protein